MHGRMDVHTSCAMGPLCKLIILLFFLVEGRQYKVYVSRASGTGYPATSEHAWVCVFLFCFYHYCHCAGRGLCYCLQEHTFSRGDCCQQVKGARALATSKSVHNLSFVLLWSNFFLLRRGSPLLIGIKSDHHILTDEIGYFHPGESWINFLSNLSLSLPPPPPLSSFSPSSPSPIPLAFLLPPLIFPSLFPALFIRFRNGCTDQSHLWAQQ